MRDTLEMMKTLITGYEKQLQEIKLIEEYKLKQSPNIIAYLFCKNYGLIYNASIKYNLLDEQDVASFCLQELDKSLINYDASKQCSFITFFITCFKNRLRAEEQSLRTSANYANYCIEDIDNHYDLEDVFCRYDVFDIENYDLTKTEIQQCNMLMDGYDIKEIAQALHNTVQGIYYRNKNIAKKLLKAL